MRVVGSLVFLIAGLATSPGIGEEPRRPNVLLLLTDDQRADTIHALGNPAIRTPNLDALAASGRVFRNAYCFGGNSAAVCLPSRQMLLSGRSFFRFKEVGPDSPTFPKTLATAGYDTYHHGKRGNTAQTIQAQFDVNRYLANDDDERRSGEPGKEIADAAIDYLETRERERPFFLYLETRERERPFFLYLAFGNPHDPRVASPETRATYRDDDIPVPTNFRPIHPFDNGELAIRDEALAPWPRTEAIVRKELADYYAVITDLDAQIGRILDALRASGEYDNTLIVFTSDQGLAMGSHGLMGKQNLYEDGMKVPLIVAGPGVPKGESAAFVYLLDLFPTVCELVGASVPEGIEGRSFAPAVRGTSDTHRDAIVLAYREVQRAVRVGDWKLIRYPKIHRSQLFDLEADPHETRDLAGDPSQADRLAGLLDELQRRQPDFGDTLPLTSEHREIAEVDSEALTRRAKAR